MTIHDLTAACDSEEADALFTLRQVAMLTDTPLPTIRHWVWVSKVLPHEHVGPTRRVRVRRSTICRFFPPNCMNL